MLISQVSRQEVRAGKDGWNGGTRLYFSPAPFLLNKWVRGMQSHSPDPFNVTLPFIGTVLLTLCTPSGKILLPRYPVVDLNNSQEFNAPTDYGSFGIIRQFNIYNVSLEKSFIEIPFGAGAFLPGELVCSFDIHYSQEAAVCQFA